MGVTVDPPRWQEALEDGLARGLPAFLPRQRWFAGKARRIARAAAEDCVWLAGGDEPGALVLVRVEYERGRPERYVLLVSLVRGAGASTGLGTIRHGDEERHLVETATGGPLALALLRHLGTTHEVRGMHGGTLAFGDVPPGGAGALDTAALDVDQVRSLGAEQSNTSLRVGGGHVFKLFRRFEAGENPEVEIGRFLVARTSFRAAPALRGSASWRPAGDGPLGTVGALQDLVENDGDGWKWTLRQLAGVLAGTAAAAPLVDAFLTLGAITAEFHAAMASRDDVPAFAPRAARAADLADWEEAFRARTASALEMLAEGRDAMPEATRACADRVLQLAPRLERIAELPAPTGAAAFARIRLHGDYHLGQTLRTPDGFVIIDFEGEPSRTLAERRALHCALKDVAGMLRSFDYAVESARAALTKDAVPAAAPPPLREAFLRGYFERADERGAPFLPADPDARARWTAFFELDKALYELEYELSNRPDWVPIPLAGVLRLVSREAS